MKQKINMTVGRFQPFTQGHLNMINEGEAPCIVYRINSSDKEIERKRKGIKIASKSYSDETVNTVISYIDNPEGELTEKDKELLKRPFTNELIEKEFEIIRKQNKNIVEVIPVINMFDALIKFNNFITENSDKYEPQYLMCGDDRVESYTKNIEAYDELEDEWRSGRKVPNVLKGRLKTNIGKGRTEGVSGSAVRKSILNKDKAAFTKIMPNGVDKLFNEFVDAFQNFKIQLQNIMQEHKITSLKDYIYECLEISESQKTWQSEIIDIAKQFIIEPNHSDFERKDIEKMIQTKKIDFSLTAHLCEYLAYIVTNKYGDISDAYELANKFRSKTKKEAYLKLHNYVEGSDAPEDKEITELIITGLKNGLTKNKDF